MANGDKLKVFDKTFTLVTTAASGALLVNEAVKFPNAAGVGQAAAIIGRATISATKAGGSNNGLGGTVADLWHGAFAINWPPGTLDSTNAVDVRSDLTKAFSSGFTAAITVTNAGVLQLTVTPDTTNRHVWLAHVEAWAVFDDQIDAYTVGG